MTELPPLSREQHVVHRVIDNAQVDHPAPVKPTVAESDHAHARPVVPEKADATPVAPTATPTRPEGETRSGSTIREPGGRPIPRAADPRTIESPPAAVPPAPSAIPDLGAHEGPPAATTVLPHFGTEATVGLFFDTSKFRHLDGPRTYNAPWK